MFNAYLWKEWRENRRSLIELAVFIPIVHVVGWTVLEPAGLWVGRRPLAVLVPALLTLLTAICVFSFDIVTREKQQRGLEFLCRLPGDTIHPFLGKAVLLALAMLLFGLVAAVSMLFIDADPGDYGVTKMKVFVFICVLFLVALALCYWGFAI